MLTAFSILGPPSCSVNFTYFRIDHFTRSTVTWQQHPNTPPVTSTTVTYCPTSSPNCGNSVTCTSQCTISGLDPCVDYNITLTPTNNCGSATGCTGSMVAAKGYNLGVYRIMGNFRIAKFLRNAHLRRFCGNYFCELPHALSHLLLHLLKKERQRTVDR